MNNLPESFTLGVDVARAFKMRLPVVALESAVITHGLPHPENINLAMQMETEVSNQGAVPATIGLMDGKVIVGLSAEQVKRLGDTSQPSRKVSRRDFGVVLARKENGGTTVAGTLIAASTAGIQVFATGGIGGVHRDSTFDISADLQELGRVPMVVVCAGAKAILDLPATLEVLETLGVPVIGFGTDDFPAFYSTSSGLPVNVRVDTPEEVAAIARAHWGMGQTSAVLVVNPPPADVALPREKMEEIIHQALQSAAAEGIHGAGVTPYMLAKVSELSGGQSMHTNLALLRNNARLAARIARAMTPGAGVEIA